MSIFSRLALPAQLQTFACISGSVNNYLSDSKLYDRLADLPIQFDNPQPRPWAPIDWQGINPSQIVGGTNLYLYPSAASGALLANKSYPALFTTTIRCSSRSDRNDSSLSLCEGDILRSHNSVACSQPPFSAKKASVYDQTLKKSQSPTFSSRKQFRIPNSQFRIRAK